MAVVPRRPKGPPLNALRAFEAAARLGSFVAAAEELGVTPGAVSQHVKAVEDWTDVALFERRAQGVALTSSGRGLASAFTAAFDQLAEATQNLRSLSPNAEIHIAALPSVAQLWLPARLGRVRAIRPELKISFTALETPPRLSRELFDMSIFFDMPSDAADQMVLAEDSLFPVCAPHLLEGFRFDTATLLHDQSWQDDWRLWSETTGTDVGDPTEGPRYSLYAFAVEEAKSGAGVLMAHGCLVEAALEAGQLCRVSDKGCQTGRALVLDLTHPARRRPQVDDFVDLLADADAVMRR